MFKISVIIPVYNVENYLRECLDSIFSQDYSDCEVICINDGSTDGSLAILEEFSKCYPNNTVVRTQKNQGQSVARNLGLDIATGDYVVFMDSDDYYLPNALSTIKYLVNQNPDNDFWYLDCATLGSARYYFFDKELNLKMDLSDYYDYEFNCYKTTPVGCLWGGIYRRKFLDDNKLRMIPGIKYEDELFVFDLFLRNGNIIATHVDEPYYFYRIGREGSITTHLVKKNFIDRLFVCRNMYKLMNEKDMVSNARKSKIFWIYDNNIFEAYLNGFWGILNEICTKRDLKIMKICSASKREKKLCKLASISPKLMAAYRTENLPAWQRRIINRFL